jgi:SNF2 family DNA or RNA helicase
MDHLPAPKDSSYSFSISTNGLDFSRPEPAPDLLQPHQLHDYQRAAIAHILQNHDAMLWLDMGLGKTIISLTVIADRIARGEIRKVLIWGPLRVIQSVWTTEARKWTHTRHLRFSIIHGTPEQRLRAVFADADVYLCNYENMNWLADRLNVYCISKGRPLPWQMVVYDEVSKLKNSTALRMKGGTRDREDGKGNPVKVKIIGWRNFINRFLFRIGLTGTPASNGYIDLHGQYLAVDGGKSLGKFVTHFKDSYFSSDYMGWKWTPTKQGKEFIEKKISPITLKMDSKDYLDMPPVKVTDLMVDLPAKARKHYRELEHDLFTELDSGRNVELFSKMSVSNKLLQVCNGQVYLNQEVYSEGYDAVHNAKLDALEDVLEEAAGQPVLCSYTFVSDAERIMKRFKDYSPVNLTHAKNTSKVIENWQAGRVRLLIGHPASMGHGIDGLQYSGSIVVWFGVNWSLELYDQMNARINRQGQKNTVKIIRILCNETVDLAVADAIERKTSDQEGLKKALQRYREGAL